MATVALSGDLGGRAAPALLVVLALAGGLGLSAAASAGGASVECPGQPAPRAGCPDLAVDPRQQGSASLAEATFDGDDCAVVEGLVEPGQRRLLRFPTQIDNLGPADLRVGAPADNPDLFEHQPCHGHHHFEDLAAYRLWTPDGYAAWAALRQAHPSAPASQLLADNPDVAAPLAASHKQGFCIVDIRPVVVHPIAPQFRSCAADAVQGITAGWADRYGAQLPGQWVDVTDVPPGNYVLERAANPERVIQETQYNDNAAAQPVSIPADG